MYFLTDNFYEIRHYLDHNPFILMRKLLLKSTLNLDFWEDLLLFELICSTCQVFVYYVCEGDKRTQKSKKMKMSFMFKRRGCSKFGNVSWRLCAVIYGYFKGSLFIWSCMSNVSFVQYVTCKCLDDDALCRISRLVTIKVPYNTNGFFFLMEVHLEANLLMP